MAQSQTNRNLSVGIAESKTLPFLTGILACLVLYVYWVYQSAHSTTWIPNNTFQVADIQQIFLDQKYSDLVKLFFYSNLATISVWQFLICTYFVCLFGIPVEKRLGVGRFLLLVLFAACLPWIVQYWDIAHAPPWPIPFELPRHNYNFFGPSSIILALAGAYMVLIPKKAKDRSNSRLPSANKVTEIFNRAERKPITEKFGLSPEVFFSALMIAVLAQHYYMMLVIKDVDSLGLYAGLVALVLGYSTATFINMGLDNTYQEHPLKHAALKKYYELLDLDVGHDSAVKGSAKGLGIPAEQVEGWVKKSRGKLRPR